MLQRSHPLGLGRQTQEARGTYERVQNLRPYRKSRGRRGTASGDAVPARRTVVSRNATRPCGDKSCRPSRGVARPRQPRHRGRCRACSRAWPQIQKMCCAPSVGEGRNTMLRRGRCASPVCEAVPTPYSYSVSIEEQKEKDRWSVHLLQTSGTSKIMPHVILSGSARLLPERGTGRLIRAWSGGPGEAYFDPSR